MIKFFRHIRQKLLIQNRFSKYLIYAVGEIILVVIGILIALQINNANEKRKEEIVINKYVKRLIQDLEKDLAYYKRSDSIGKIQLRDIAKLRDTFLIVPNETGFKYVVEHLNENLPELYVSSKTYDEMVASGVLYAIENKGLLAEIQDYYNWSSINQYYIKANNNDLAALWREPFYNYVIIGRHNHKTGKSYNLNLEPYNNTNPENSIKLKAYLIKYHENEAAKFTLIKDQIKYSSQLIKMLKDSLSTPTDQ